MTPRTALIASAAALAAVPGAALTGVPAAVSAAAPAAVPAAALTAVPAAALTAVPAAAPATVPAAALTAVPPAALTAVPPAAPAAVPATAPPAASAETPRIAAARSEVLCPGADVAPEAGDSPAAAAALLCVVDGERRARGLRPLRDEAHLRFAARRWAKRLSASREQPRSSAASTLRRIAASGYRKGRGFAYGEALGHGPAPGLTPWARVRAWLRDAATRRLLLSRDFQDAGAAVRTAHGETIFVLELGGPVRTRQ